MRVIFNALMSYSDVTYISKCPDKCLCDRNVVSINFSRVVDDAHKVSINRYTIILLLVFVEELNIGLQKRDVKFQDNLPIHSY